MFTLIRRARDTDFKGAIAFVADLAGVSLDTRVGRSEVERQRRNRERVQAAGIKLVARERELRFAYRESWRELEHLAHRVALQNSNGRHDALLAGLPAPIRQDAAAYSLLAFGNVAARVKFLVQPECRRRAVDAVLAGMVRDGGGRVIEVVT